MAGTLETTVTESMLASSVGSGKVCVFSTAMMVAWMEATAVDVAQAALFLAGDASSYITGEVIKIDGGMGM